MEHDIKESEDSQANSLLASLLDVHNLGKHRAIYVEKIHPIDQTSLVAHDNVWLLLVCHLQQPLLLLNEIEILVFSVVNLPHFVHTQAAHEHATYVPIDQSLENAYECWDQQQELNGVEDTVEEHAEPKQGQPREDK